MALLADLHADGATICIVTHDPRYAEYADPRGPCSTGASHIDEETLNRLRKKRTAASPSRRAAGRLAQADLKED